MPYTVVRMTINGSTIDVETEELELFYSARMCADRHIEDLSTVLADDWRVLILEPGHVHEDLRKIDTALLEPRTGVDAPWTT